LLWEFLGSSWYTLRPSLISSAVLGYSLNWIVSTAELRSFTALEEVREVMVDQGQQQQHSSLGQEQHASRFAPPP